MAEYALYIQLGGALLIALGLIWLIIAAFTEKIWWGLGVLLLLPLVGLIFIIVHWKKGLWPFLVCLLGLGVIATPAAYTLLTPDSLEPLLQTTSAGKLRLTLTKSKEFEYSDLRKQTDLQELEMSGPEVNDDMLSFIAGLEKLEYLNVSKSNITDEGLRHLKNLKNLNKLYIDDTKISNEGLINYLVPLESLKMLRAQRTLIDETGAVAFMAADKKRRIMYPRTTKKKKETENGK